MRLERMLLRRTKTGRWRRLLTGLALGVVVLLVCGCHTCSFYAQAVKGQYQLLTRKESIKKLAQDPDTPETLKQRLDVLNELRHYAEKQLHLPVDGHYQHYIDLKREFVVWNVQAAPEFSLQPKTWWYPVVGSLEYRGYFSVKGAQHYADYLARKGLDTYVGGADAYSTLGWFKDPVLNTFIYHPDPFLAELLFHELAHQRVFASGDTDFNEAFATTVGQEAARQWVRRNRSTNDLHAYEGYLARNDQFVRLVMKTRSRLESLYGDERSETGKITAASRNRGVEENHLRREKANIIAGMRQEYESLKQNWNGKADYDRWFSEPITNAKLNSIAAYYDLVPGFEKLLESSSHDWRRFYDEVKRLAKMSRKDRHQWLRTLAKAGAPETDGLIGKLTDAGVATQGAVPRASTPGLQR